MPVDTESRHRVCSWVQHGDLGWRGGQEVVGACVKLGVETSLAGEKRRGSRVEFEAHPQGRAE